MNSRSLTIWFFILLLISLVVNGILGVLLFNSMKSLNHNVHFYEAPDMRQHQSGNERPDRMDLDSPQVKVLRDSFLNSKKELMQELVKDKPDYEQAKKIIARSVDTQVKLENALGNQLLEQRKGMSAEDAAKNFSQRLDRINKMNNRRH
jgi:hypothetical protein